MSEWLTWIAQEDPVGSTIPDLLQYGVLAFVLIALMFGYLLTKPAVEQERKLHADAVTRLEGRIADAESRAVRAEQQRDDLLKQVTEALPVVEASNEASRRMIPILEALIERFDERARRSRS